MRFKQTTRVIGILLRLSYIYLKQIEFYYSSNFKNYTSCYHIKNY